MGGSQSQIKDRDEVGSQSQAKGRYEAHIVDIESSDMLEKQIRGSAAPLPMKTLLDVSNAVCKISVENKTGTGFLAKFAVITGSPGSGSWFHGLFTNNHVLSEHHLADHQTFTIQFDAIPVGTSTDVSSFATTVKISGFRFTCPILDATFILFDDKIIQSLTSSGCRFLEVASEEWEGSKGIPVFIVQHPGGASMHFAQGIFLKYYGLDMFHAVSTDYGSSGSPVTTSDGHVIGLHKARSTQSNNNYNIAVTMKAVIRALRPHFSNPNFPRYLVCNPITFGQTYAATLLQIGLEMCFISPNSKFQLMYVSPASLFVTPIWFVPTSHGWYWTPTNPSSQEKETNWMPVSQLKVIGGYWHGEIPASKNVKIIHWLLQHNIVCGICPS